MSELFDVSFFKAFVDGALHTFKIQCSTVAEPGKPFFKKPGGESNFEITAILGLASATFTGTLSVCYPKDVFVGLMNRMLHENNTEITDDSEDGAAELLNIIFGHAKRVLNGQGHAIEMAIPTIIRGKGLTTRHIGQTRTMVLPFKTDLGEICIEICARPAEAKS